MRGLMCAALALWPSAALSHPHIFVDATLEVVFSADGQPEVLRIGWRYDPIFSMLLVGDLGLDADFDGVLTPEEHTQLQGFDMNWDPGYPGDTHLTQAGSALPLGPPRDWTSDYVDGQLHSTHLRDLPPLIDATAQWVIAVYDPTYYTSYTLAAAPVLTGRSDCSVKIFEPDFTALEANLQAALDEMLGSGADLEAEFPMVGAMFAQEVRITCPAR
jgi:ABC-type uncharacterized transport system substrate-binding protein